MEDSRDSHEILIKRSPFNTAVPSLQNVFEIEERESVQQVREGLHRALALGDFQLANFYSRQINDLIQLGYELQRKDCIFFSQALFELITIPGVEPSFQAKWCSTLTRLLKKMKKRLLFSSSSSHQLRFDWRRMYELIVRFHFESSSDVSSSSFSSHSVSSPPSPPHMGKGFAIYHLGRIIRLVRKLHNFFGDPLTITKEILLELSPEITPFSDRIFKVQVLLTNFLPTRSSEAVELWLDSMLAFLDDGWMGLNADWDYHILSLLARAVKHLSSSSPYSSSGSLSLWSSEERIRRLFTAFARLIQSELQDSRLPSPMERKTPENCLSLSPRDKHSKRFRFISKIIIYLLRPQEDVNNSLVQQLFKELLTSIRAYFHPSNTGGWSNQFATFLQGLADYFTKRVRRESSPSASSSLQGKLQKKDRDSFFEIVDIVLLNALFSRNRGMCHAGRRLARAVAFDDPRRLKDLIPKLTPVLEDPAALVGRQNASGIIETLGYLVAPLLSDLSRFPSGITILSSLLSLVESVGGIDPNDSSKTSATLRFNIALLHHIPLEYDSSSVSMDDASSDSMQIQEGDDENEREETRAATRELLASLYDRAHSFLDSFLFYVTQLEKPQKKELYWFLPPLAITFNTLFGQCSSELYLELVKKLSNFLSENLLPNAEFEVAALCKAAVSANPAEGLKQLLPVLHRRLVTVDEEDKNGRRKVLGQNLRDEDARFLLRIYSTMLERAGEHVLHYLPMIRELLDASLAVDVDKKVFRVASLALKSTLSTLTSTFSLDLHSLPPSVRASQEFKENPSKFWAYQTPLEEVDIQWHIPTPREIEAAVELATFYSKSSFMSINESLQSSTSSPSSSSSSSSSSSASVSFTSKLYKALRLIRAVLMGASKILADEQEENADRSEYRSTQKGLPITTGQDPVLLTLRAQTATLLHQLVDYLHRNGIQDVIVLQQLSKAIGTCIISQNHSGFWLHLNASLREKLANPLKKGEGKKIHLRSLQVNRVELQHRRRIEKARREVPLSQGYRILLFDLLTLSTHSFSSVRQVAQKNFLNSLKTVPRATSKLLPSIIERLSMNSLEDDEVTGIVYLLLTTSLARRVAREWQFFTSFIVALCSTFNRSKPSLQEKINQLFLLFALSHCSPNIRQPHVLLKDRASALISSSPSEDLRRIATEKQSFHVKKNIESWNKAVTSLLNLQSVKTHWRYQTMQGACLLLLFKAAERDPELSSQANLFISTALATTIRTTLVGDSTGVRTLGTSASTYFLQKIAREERKRLPKSLRSALDLAAQLRENSLVPQPHQHQIDKVLVDNNWFGWNGKGSYLCDVPITSSTPSLTSSITSGMSSLLCDPKFLENWIGHLVRDHKTAPPEGVPGSSGQVQDLMRSGATEVLLSNLGFNPITIFSGGDKRGANFADIILKEMGENRRSYSRSLESDVFNVSNVKIFKLCFEIFKVDFLKAIQPILVRLCCSSEREDQCTAAEIFSGLIRSGCKYWSQEDTQGMWEFVTLVLPGRLWNSTFENVSDWISAIRIAVRQRDPRRLTPLVKILLQKTPSPPSSSSSNLSSSSFQTKQLQFLLPILQELGWRSNFLIEDIFQLISRIIQEGTTHPVREQIGYITATLIDNSWEPFRPTFVIESPPPIHPIVSAFLDFFSSKLYQLSLSSGDSDQSNKVLTELRSIMLFMFEAALSFGSPTTSSILLQKLLPSLFLASNDTDKDIGKLSKKTLGILARDIVAHRNVLPLLFGTLSELANPTSKFGCSWHVRQVVLPFFQVATNGSWYLLKEEERDCCIEMIITMLRDPLVEVRELGTSALSLVLRPLPDSRIKELRDRFIAMSGSGGNASRKRNNPSVSAQTDPLKEIERHAGVLGLAALVLMAPYDIPSWLPETLVNLTKHFGATLVSTRKTVRDTFAEFWRTHKDMWELQHSAAFDQDQLEAIHELLISPSYYA